MAKSEAHVWRTLKGLGKKRMLLERFECRTPGGVPDVHYLTCGEESGWIELKNIKVLPKRPTTPVRIDHFTRQQQLWLITYGSLGGHAWIFIGFPDDIYMLFSWKVAYCLGSWTYDELYDNAELVLDLKMLPISGYGDSEELISTLERKPIHDGCHVEPHTFVI